MARLSVVIPSRDGADYLPATLDSLLAQEGVEVSVAVCVDASVDGTLGLLVDRPVVKYEVYPIREPKDYTRVPLLLNIAMRLVPEADYYMVSGDDTTYPPDYAYRIIQQMEKHKVSIGSGWSSQYMFRPTNAPGGSGRIFTKDAWQLVTPFPEGIIWETWALYRALEKGLRLQMFNVQKSHNRPQTAESTITFGYAAHMLGTPILFTAFRVLLEMWRGPRRRWPAFMILVGQLEYTVKCKPRREDIVPYVKKTKYRQLWRNVKTLFIRRTLLFVRRKIRKDARA